VSVIVPLYNGGATIERTLASALAQTWSNLEVLVVDDGSTDDGPERVERVAARDRRVRLLQQTNAGVAAARNCGAAQARSEHLAFLDADDLWTPEKVALQMEAMEGGGDAVGLAYTWSALIDDEDRVYSTAYKPEAEGRVFRDMCRGNMIGNGSSVLIRRAAFERVGGFDSTLRERGAQGCEDLVMYLAIAEHYEFRVVRRFLTGYRTGEMSSDGRQMLRSFDLALAGFARRYPQYAVDFEAHRRDMVQWLVVRALTVGRAVDVLPLVAQERASSGRQLAAQAPCLLWLTLKARAPRPLKRALRRVVKREVPYRPPFLEIFGGADDPTIPVHVPLAANLCDPLGGRLSAVGVPKNT
jgi:glycosyltransferase involved in cell wall biosynthesis